MPRTLPARSIRGPTGSRSPGRRATFPGVAKSPDPTLMLATSRGVTRTLDDWSTMFQLCLVMLPARREARAWLPVARRIFATLGDTDCTCALVVTGSAEITRRILGPTEASVLTFVDPDHELIASLGVERLPAFVHLRQDTTLASCAEGWTPGEWQQVAREVARAMAWTVPEVRGSGDPPRTRGWPVAAV